MKVFVTGATGFIGTAVTRELIKHGHSVLGLARNEASASKVTAAGGTAHVGDIEDLESLRTGAAQSDGIVHLAFHHQYMFTDFGKACEVDRTAIRTIGDAIAGSGKPLVIASGTLMMTKGKLAFEDDEPDRVPNPPFTDRAMSGDLVRGLQGVRGMEMRLAPTIHGPHDHGFMKMFIDAAKKIGAATFIGNGENRWPACGVHDAATLFRLALEKGKAGAAYHATGEEGVKMKDIQELIGKQLDVPVESKKQGDTAGLEPLGFLLSVLAYDNPSSSEKTRKELGWQPSDPELLADLKLNYFK